MVLIVSWKTKSISPFVKTLFLILALWISVSFSGCVEQYAGGTPQPATPSPGEEAQQPAMVPTQTVIAEPSMVPAEEGQSGYISRSFGLIPYGPPPDYHITYIESAAKRDGTGAVYIQGMLKNDGPSNLNYIHLVYVLYDYNGNVLGNVDATLEYLQAGATWRYTTSSFQTDYYQYYQLAGVIAQ
jgi:hypothetical protein